MTGTTCPTVVVTFFEERVIALTVTLHFNLVFPEAAVIVAVPALLAVTFPLMTAATFLLLEDHFTDFSPVVFKDKVWPTYKMAFVLEIFGLDCF